MIAVLQLAAIIDVRAAHRAGGRISEVDRRSARASSGARICALASPWQTGAIPEVYAVACRDAIAEVQQVWIIDRTDRRRTVELLFLQV